MFLTSFLRKANYKIFGEVRGRGFGKYWRSKMSKQNISRFGKFLSFTFNCEEPLRKDLDHEISQCDTQEQNYPKVEIGEIREFSSSKRHFVASSEIIGDSQNLEIYPRHRKRDKQPSWRFLAKLRFLSANQNYLRIQLVKEYS